MTLTLNTIAKRFAKANQTYDDYANVQKLAANLLLDKIISFPKGEPQTILDLGTGTGYLARKLALYFPKANLTLNDICPQMLKTCQDAFASKENVTYQIADMEKLNLDPYDYIVSNFAFQWAKNLRKLIIRSKTKAQQLFAFSTLIRGSFAKWEHYINQHTPFTNLDYPEGKDLKNFCQDLCQEGEEFQAFIKNVQLSFKNPQATMKYLQGVGASAAQKNLPLSVMKQLYLDKDTPICLDYNIFFGLFIMPKQEKHESFY